VSERATKHQLAVARSAGRFVGALLDSGAEFCPWRQEEQPDLRSAWLRGFGEGRAARIQLADTRWPEITITRTALKGS
jgi:ribosome modulation factor